MNIEEILSAKAEFIQKLDGLETSLKALDPSNLDLYLTRSVELYDEIHGVKAALTVLESLETEAIQQGLIASETQRIEVERQRVQSLEAELENRIKALI